MSFLRLWILIATGVVLTIVGDVFLKRSNGTERPMELFVGMLFYTLGAIPVVLAFKRTEFGLVFVIWESITVVLAIIIGRALFGEHVTSYRIVAIALALAALGFRNRVPTEH